MPSLFTARDQGLGSEGLKSQGGEADISWLRSGKPLQISNCSGDGTGARSMFMTINEDFFFDEGKSFGENKTENGR